jgi:hypothetical protein
MQTICSNCTSVCSFAELVGTSRVIMTDEQLNVFEALHKSWSKYSAKV